MQLMSSMQPISTTLWPSNGSSPVVSVSSTISRNVLLSPTVTLAVIPAKAGIQ
jgi:hypothetical protein